MKAPTVIKGPLPGQAVEAFRQRNGGKLPGANVIVSLDMVDDALTLLEGWIERYCKPRFKDEHLRNLEEKRAHLAAAPEAPRSSAPVACEHGAVSQRLRNAARFGSPVAPREREHAADVIDALVEALQFIQRTEKLGAVTDATARAALDKAEAAS